MIGMLQIITYLLCVYLVFKGFEIAQLAVTSARENRGPAFIIGILAVAISICAAFYFVSAIDSQATAVSQHSSTSSP
jgi:uncharacterized membrane protein